MLIPLGFLAASGAAAGSFDLLETTVLTGSQASVEFTNLTSKYASTYQHLQLRATFRTSRNSSLDGIQMQFNTDTGSNYSSHNLQGSGSGSPTSSGSASQTSVTLAYSPGSTNTANAFATFVCDILDPFETSKNKTIRSLAGQVDSNWTLINLWSGAWLNTNSTTSLKIYSGNAANLVQYSRFSLYGLKAA